MKILNVNKENPNGVLRDATAEEITQMETDKAKGIEEKTAEDAVVAQKATDKASAKAKLIAGEALTEAEADTIVL
jgi:Tfp pilus assembly protein PilN